MGWKGGEREAGGCEGSEVGLWRVGGLLSCQVCFSHTHTQPLSFHGGVSAALKNDKARH